MEAISNDLVVAIFKDHEEAEVAIKELQTSGFDMKQLSIVGKDYSTEEHVVGYYNLGDRAANWGKTGAFWGWIWGLLFGSALIFIPGVGPVMFGGPIVRWLIGALETAVAAGGVSAFGGALLAYGLPEDSVLKYETALKANEFIVIAHGTKAQIQRLKIILEANKAESATLHSKLVGSGA